MSDYHCRREALAMAEKFERWSKIEIPEYLQDYARTIRDMDAIIQSLDKRYLTETEILREKLNRFYEEAIKVRRSITYDGDIAFTIIVPRQLTSKTYNEIAEYIFTKAMQGINDVIKLQRGETEK